LVFSSCNDIKNKNVTEITIWSSSTSSKVEYENLVDNFNQTIGKEKNIYINYITIDSLLIKERLSAAFEEGNSPDMFLGFSKEFAEKGYIVPIKELEGGNEFLKDFGSVPMRSENSLNEDVYCLPISVTTQGLLYNKEMFKKANLVDENGNPTPPETLEELREYAKILTNPDKDEYGIVLPLAWGSWYGSDIRSLMMSSCGFQEFNPVTGKYDYSGAVPIMETFLGIKEDKTYVPGAEKIDNDTARALFASGGVGMKFGFSFDVGVLNDQYPANIDWGVAPFPVADRNNKYKQRMSYGYSFCVTKKAKDTVDNKKLIEVLNYFTSDETLEKFYLSGTNVPYKLSIVDNVKIDESKIKKGWKDFYDLVKISAIYPEIPVNNLASSQRIDNCFVENVWTGKMTPYECAKLSADEINASVFEYYQKLPDEEFNKFLIPDWDIKR